ncbi:MAG TPA: hypothetical protein VHE59_00415 [Mucilaginibacter sp.]|nr:hypothetical protein [Mucilaginibacter sp.]
MRDVTPPNKPWKELQHKSGAGGTLSFYYSDTLSRLPVRAVTKVGDNKADPNLETLTYGLFSTCQRDLRASIVRDGRKDLFFTSRWRDQRVLVGYYSIKWYAPVANTVTKDFAIAADEAYFISDPPSLEQVDKKCGTQINKKFRLTTRLTDGDCAKLKAFLFTRVNAIEEYLSEIHRLEFFNKAQGGHFYIGRKLDEPYSWQSAIPYLNDEILSVDNSVIKNSSPSDWWTCNSCGKNHKNKALLRICPNCKAINSLTPLSNIPELI